MKKNKKLKILIAFIVLISITTKVEAMEVVSCGNLANVPYKPLEFIGNIIKLVQILVPVVLVIFGMIDMAKAMIAHDEKQQKDAQHIFIKRIIYAVLVYFVVAMVQFLFGLLGAGDSIMKCASCVVGGKCETTQLQVSKEEPGTTNNASNKDSPIGSVASRTTKVTSVKFTSKKTELAEGKTFQTKATVRPAKAPQNVKYKSSNTSVATISSSGKIKAKKEGVTTITVQSQSNKSKKDTFKLKVIDPLDAKRNEVVAYAKKFVGNPYVYGGSSLTKGTDCSGFTMSVYKKFGYSLPHHAASQRSSGKKVANLSKAKPGDLICYDGHVALYIGNNKIVHASNSQPYPKGGIKISSPPNYRTIVAIRRIIN